MPLANLHIHGGRGGRKFVMTLGRPPLNIKEVIALRWDAGSITEVGSMGSSDRGKRRLVRALMTHAAEVAGSASAATALTVASFFVLVGPRLPPFPPQAMAGL
jgi:hypothetical protein